MISLPGSLLYGTSPMDGPRVPVRRNNARLSECPSRLPRALRAEQVHEARIRTFHPRRRMTLYRASRFAAFNHRCYRGSAIREEKNRILK